MKYFKTDGIRGEAYSIVTLDLCHLIGLFFSKSDKKIIIGIDTRESSPYLAHAVICGLKNHKDVMYAGVIPTSGLMYYSLVNKTIAIMITASHNQYKDNGIKVIIDGKKISKDLANEIEMFIEKNIDVVYKEKFNELNLVVENEIVDSYVEFIKKRMPTFSYNIIFDGANGALSPILKQLYSDKYLINCEPNGKNINFECGSTSPANLIKQVKLANADLGIAFDGDGDRLCVVDKFNRIYEGDLLTFIFGKYLNDNNLLLAKTMVFTEVVNPGILDRVTYLGMYYIIVEIGDQNIYLALESGYTLGGEASGHIINRNILPFGDGLLNALELIKILKLENKKIHEYLYGVKLYYSKKININTPPMNFNLSKRTTNKLEKFNKKRNITLIIRKSGTEELVRLFLYQPNNKRINYNINKIVRIIQNDTK